MNRTKFDNSLKSLPGRTSITIMVDKRTKINLLLYLHDSFASKFLHTRCALRMAYPNSL